MALKLFRLDSIRKKMFVASSLQVLLLVACIIILLGYSLKERAERDFLARSSEEIAHATGMVDTMFDGIFADLAVMGRFPPVARGDKSIGNYVNSAVNVPNSEVKRGPQETAIYDFLRLFRDAVPEYDSVVWGNDLGQYVNSNPKGVLLKGFDPRKRLWYLTGQQDKGTPVVSKSFQNTSGENVACSSLRYDRHDGVTPYVVAICVSLRKLSDRIARVRFGQTGHLILVEADGTILAHPQKELLTKNISELKVDALAEAIRVGDRTLHYKNAQGAKLARVMTVPRTNWRLVGVIDEEEILQGARSMIKLVLLVGCGFALLALVVGFFMARRISRPVTALVEVLNETAKGDFTRRIDAKYERSRDEIGVLAGSFNRFVDKMSQTIASVVAAS